jgi:hypothetical protein
VLLPGLSLKRRMAFLFIKEKSELGEKSENTIDIF